MGILALIIGGLIIGGLARLVIPGRDPIGLLWTMLLGIAGMIVGGLIGNALFNRNGGFILAVISSVLLLVGYKKLRTHRA